MWREYFPKAKIFGFEFFDKFIESAKKDKLKNVFYKKINVCLNGNIKKTFKKCKLKFDIIIDDGSHQVAHVNKTFQYLYPKMSKDGVYLVEDTHAAYWKDSHGGGLNEPESIINVSKNLIDKLNADHTKGQVEPDDFTKSTQSITFYDSVIVFERGEIHWKQPLEFGKNTPKDYAPNPELQQAAEDFTIRT